MSVAVIVDKRRLRFQVEAQEGSDKALSFVSASSKISSETPSDSDSTVHRMA